MNQEFERIDNTEKEQYEFHIGAVLEDIMDKGLTLIPLCPFVALYLQRNPQWKQLVLKGIKIA